MIAYVKIKNINLQSILSSLQPNCCLKEFSKTLVRQSLGSFLNFNEIVMTENNIILINTDFLNNLIFTVSCSVAQIDWTFPCHLQNHLYPVLSWIASNQGPYQLCYVQRDQDTHAQNGHQLLYNEIQPYRPFILCDLCPDYVDSVTWLFTYSSNCDAMLNSSKWHHQVIRNN